MIPPRPTAELFPAPAELRFQQWKYDSIMSLLAKQGPGFLTSVRTKGVVRIPQIPKPLRVGIPSVEYFEAIYPPLWLTGMVQTPIQVTNGIAFEKATDGCSYTWGAVSNNPNTRGGFYGRAITQSYRFRRRRYRISWQNAGANARTLDEFNSQVPYNGVVIPYIGLHVATSFAAYARNWVQQNGVWYASISQANNGGRVLILQSESGVEEFESRGSVSDMIAASTQVTAGTKIAAMRGANDVWVKSAVQPTILEYGGSDFGLNPANVIDSLTLDEGSTNENGSATLTLTINAYDLSKDVFIGFAYGPQGGLSNAARQTPLVPFWNRNLSTQFTIRVTALP